MKYDKTTGLTTLDDGRQAGRMFAKVTPVEGSESKKNHLGGIGIIEVWASTESVDRHNEIVRASAFTKSVARMEKTGKYPPFLPAHMHTLSDGSVPVLGRVVPGSVEIIEGKGMKCQVAFVPASVNKHAPAWFEGYKTQALTDVSVGFIAEKMKRPDGPDEHLEHTQADWMELSGAAVGSNRDADTISVSKGVLDLALAAGKSYSPALTELLTGLRELAELQERQACGTCKLPAAYKRDGDLVTIDLAAAKARGDDLATLAAYLKAEGDDEEAADDAHTHKAEVTEDDEAVHAQIADGDLEYVDGSVREIELEAGDMPVTATVGVRADDDEGAETITFLTFPKAEGWDVAKVEEWLAAADLDALLEAALGDSDEDDDSDDAGDADDDTLELASPPEGGCPDGTEWCSAIGECVPMTKHQVAHALPELLPKVLKPTLDRLDHLVKRQERATANAEAMQTAMQTMTARAAELLDTLNKVAGAVPATSKSVKSVAPGHDADDLQDDPTVVARLEKSLQNTLALRNAGSANGRV